MTIRTSLAALMAAASVALLSGCATTIPGVAHAGATLPHTTLPNPQSPSPPEEAAQTADLDTGPLGTNADDDTLPPAEPPVAAPETNADTAATEPAVSGSDDIYAADIAWLSTFCSGFTDIVSNTDFDATGMSDDETLQAIVDAYTGMVQDAELTAYQLEGLAPPLFPGADALTTAILDWLAAADDNYARGANAIANGSFDSAAQVNAVIDGTESGMRAPNEALSDALSGADPSVKEAIAGLPECAPLL